MNTLAARVAPEIDRLVLGVNGAVGPRHGRVLMAAARELGLDSLKLIPHVGDFWLDGPLTAELVEARMPYAPSGSVSERLDRFVELGLLSETASGLEPTPLFRPLLAAAIAAREDVAREVWTGHKNTMSELDSLMDRVIGAVTASHSVAVAHRALTPAADPYLRLYDRLVTMRFVRQHDHVEAWRAQGLTPAAMTVLTPLWRDEPVPAETPGGSLLEERGLVENGQLTEEGRRLRDEIELETNERGQRTLSVLDEDGGDRLVQLLKMLPVPPSV